MGTKYLSHSISAEEVRAGALPVGSVFVVPDHRSGDPKLLKHDMMGSGTNRAISDENVILRRSTLKEYLNILDPITAALPF